MYSHCWTVKNVEIRLHKTRRMNDDVRRWKRHRLSQLSAPPLLCLLSFLCNLTELFNRHCNSDLAAHSCPRALWLWTPCSKTPAKKEKVKSITLPPTSLGRALSKISLLSSHLSLSIFFGVKLSAGPFSCHRPLLQNPLPCVTRSRVKSTLAWQENTQHTTLRRIDASATDPTKCHARHPRDVGVLEGGGKV